MTGMQVWYLEGKGEAARDALEALLPRLSEHAGFLGGELLLSPQQPELSLLQSRWQGEVPPLALPAGVRGWVFVVQAAKQPAG